MVTLKRFCLLATSLGMGFGCGGGDAEPAPTSTPTSGGSGLGTGGGGSSAADATGGAETGGNGSVSPGAGGSAPASCAEAVRPYVMGATPIASAPALGDTTGGWGSDNFALLPVAVDPRSGQTYVGYTSASGDAVIASPDGVVASTAGAHLAGLAVTNDGLAALHFDPNPDVDARSWAAVVRYGADGSPRFSTDLFRSPNLDDVGTKGAPGSSRFGYLAGSDALVAYFGHTQRYDDGVRHQGGYLALVHASGEQELLSGWIGSHNLDQRLLIDAAGASLLGLGDAYPKGIFYSTLERPRANVIFPLAADGVGSTNGQLGGMVDLGDAIAVPFATNRSIPQDLDAGTWPDIDDTISSQISAVAANATDLGLLLVNKGATPEELNAIWLEPQLAADASLVELKSAPYGAGGLILLVWAEQTGSGRSAQVAGRYTMVIDRAGAVCQPKTPLDAAYAPPSGDDLVARPDGVITWANAIGSSPQLVTLTP